MLLVMEETGLASAGPDRSAASQFSLPATEIIDFSVQLSRLLGQPATNGGDLRFAFRFPLSLVMDNLIERLQLSIRIWQRTTRMALRVVPRMLSSSAVTKPFEMSSALTRANGG